VRFSTALHKGILVRRYKRFLADVELPKEGIVTAHCPNTGSMESCFTPGGTVWLSRSTDPSRKLQWTWELSEMNGGLVGINTARPNQVIAEAIEQKKIPELCGYETLRKEVKYGQNSRIDILLESSNKPPCFVEIKNTTLLRNNHIMFPDAVTERGLKHIQELCKVAQSGSRAVLLFFVNRPDGEEFLPAESIDPKYTAALREASKVGLEVIAIRGVSSPDELRVGHHVRINLGGLSK
jgi:sugar fermentation stimulation protein A